jgi:D-3-phosphoglycerate dehydrogenase
MKIKGKVIITQSIHDEGMRLLEENIEEVILASDPSEETLMSLMDESVIGIVVRHNKLTKNILDKAPNLKVISRHGIGVELIDLEEATSRHIPVVNTPYAATTSVAEHTVMMILVLAKKLLFAHNEFCAGGYGFKNTYLPQDVQGMTLGVLGIGNIGSQVIRRAYGFDLNIIAYDTDISAKRADKIKSDYNITIVDSMEEVLKTADIVTIHVPSNEKNYKMIGKEQLEMMKPSAFLINCARGEILDEGALIDALNNKTIAGAGIDVFDPEPPSVDNPLLKMDNVILTPHSSALTVQGKIRMSRGSAEQMLKVLSNEKPDYLVNKQVSDIWEK